MTTVPVRKTGYRKKKIPNVARGKSHMAKRSLSEFPPPRLEADGIHEIGQSVQLIKAVYKSGVEGGLANEFPQSVPGEYGSYQGIGVRMEGGKLVERCKIKLGHCVAFLPDDGLHFRWL